VIGDGNGLAARLSRVRDKILDAAGAVQKAIFTVNMQMRERHCVTPCDGLVKKYLFKHLNTYRGFFQPLIRQHQRAPAWLFKRAKYKKTSGFLAACLITV
jgi:hypothetical protein